MDNPAKDVMTVPELCQYLQLSEAKVRDMLRRGKLPAVLIGRQWRIRKSAIDHWLEEQESQPHVYPRQKVRTEPEPSEQTPAVSSPKLPESFAQVTLKIF